MAYPDDKETFRRVVNQELPAVAGDIVDEDDQNLPAKFLEDLQDTLGYNIKMGYATVKAFFDYVNTQVALIAGKANKTGDTFSGDILLDNGAATSPKLYFEATSYHTFQFIYSSGAFLKLQARDGFEFKAKVGGVMFEVNIAGESSFRQTVNHYGNNITRVGDIELDSPHEITIKGNGKGVIVKTPDGTKNYRISVDNAGNVITTQV